jgi:FKBP-type peptidyl-prolyl cis-trans isomerase
MLMRTGAEFRFFVHPSLGYGSQGSTRIEPNTLLIFDVELVEIVEPTN